MPNDQIPHHIVTEAIGNFTLKGSEENQVYIAEQIASNTYSSMEDLCSTIEGYAPKTRFKKELKEVKESQFFKPYFGPQWPAYKEGDKIRYWEWRVDKWMDATIAGPMIFQDDNYEYPIACVDNQVHYIVWDEKEKRWESGEI